MSSKKIIIILITILLLLTIIYYFYLVKKNDLINQQIECSQLYILSSNLDKEGASIITTKFGYRTDLKFGEIMVHGCDLESVIEEFRKIPELQKYNFSIKKMLSY